MGTIHKCFYGELDHDQLHPYELANSHFLNNMIKIDPSLVGSYEMIQGLHFRIQNRFLADAWKRGELPKKPNPSKVISGISSLKNCTVVIMEL